MGITLNDYMNQIMLPLNEEREKILIAFLAQYNLLPSEAEQVYRITSDGVSWHVKKRATAAEGSDAPNGPTTADQAVALLKMIVDEYSPGCEINQHLYDEAKRIVSQPGESREEGGKMKLKYHIEVGSEKMLLFERGGEYECNINGELCARLLADTIDVMRLVAPVDTGAHAIDEKGGRKL